MHDDSLPANAAQTSSPANGSSRASSRGPPSTTVTSSAAQALEGLGHLGTDRAATEDEQPAGQLLGRREPRLSHGFTSASPGIGGIDRNRAGRKDDGLRRLERRARAVGQLDLDFALASEPAGPAEKLDALFSSHGRSPASVELFVM